MFSFIFIMDYNGSCPSWQLSGAKPDRPWIRAGFKSLSPFYQNREKEASARKGFFGFCSSLVCGTPSPKIRSQLPAPPLRLRFPE